MQVLYGPKNLNKEEVQNTERLSNLFNKWVDALTKWLSYQWVKTIGENTYLLLPSIKFAPPPFSGCLASASLTLNVWHIFKDDENKTLDEVYRG